MPSAEAQYAKSCTPAPESAAAAAQVQLHAVATIGTRTTMHDVCASNGTAGTTWPCQGNNGTVYACTITVVQQSWWQQHRQDAVRPTNRCLPVRRALAGTPACKYLQRACIARTFSPTTDHAYATHSTHFICRPRPTLVQVRCKQTKHNTPYTTFNTEPCTHMTTTGCHQALQSADFFL
jgi:hypothetical protein